MRPASIGQEYAALLRAALWGGTFAGALSHLSAVLQLADAQRTIPLVGDVLYRMDRAPEGPAGKRLESIMGTMVYLHDKLDTEIAALVGLLAGEGIPSVLLKGQGLARYYPSATLRECGDIDLWVPEAHYSRACDLLLAYEQGKAEVTFHQSDKHFHLRREYVIVELHRRAEVLPNPRKDELYLPLEQDGLTRNLVPLDFGGVVVNTPADTFNAFYVFLHAWNHFTGYGVGVRQVCDWALFLHAKAGKLDQDALRRSLDTLGLLRPWQVFGALAVEVLGLPADEMPFYQPRLARRGRNLFDLMVEEGNFGKERSVRKHRPANTLKKKTGTVWALFVRAFRLMPVFRGLGFTLFFRGIGSGFRKVFGG